MVLFLLIDAVPTVLLLTLAASVYLAAIELRELRPHWLWWFWWLLLVLLLHFPAYLLLRGYSFYAKRQAKRARA